MLAGRAILRRKLTGDRAPGIYLKFYLIAALDRIKLQSQIDKIGEKWRKPVDPASAGSAEREFDSRWRYQ